MTCSDTPTGLTRDICDSNSENTREKVNGQCDKQNSCELVASKIFFDDNSCSRVYKYLKVKYECKADDMNSMDILKEGGRRRRKKKRDTKEKRSFRDS